MAVPLAYSVRIPMHGSGTDPVSVYFPSAKRDSFLTVTGATLDPTKTAKGAGALRFYGSASSVYISTSQGYVNSNAGCDFTLQFYVEAATVSPSWQGLIAQDSNNGIYLHNNRFSVYFGGEILVSPPVNANQLYHLALCRKDGVLTMYVDGNPVGSVSTINGMSLVYFGRASSGSEYFTGWMCEVLYVEEALYSGAFTPPDPMDLGFNTFKTNPLTGLKLAAKGDVQPTFSGAKTLNKLDLLTNGYRSGTLSISGTVKEAHTPSDIPLSRRVRVYRKSDGILVDETWSDNSGYYQFNRLSKEKYYVTSFDHTGTYNAVIKDSIVPE